MTPNHLKVSNHINQSRRSTTQLLLKLTEERRRNSAKDFDRAFAAARRAGKQTFMWRGKSYNTKLK